MNKFTIDWVGKRGLFFAISGTLCLASLGAIAGKGFNYGIDFVGGTLVQVAYAEPRELGQVRADLAKAGYEDAQARSFGSKQEFALFLKGTETQDASIVETFVDKFKAAAGPGLRVDRKEFVGPSVGRHLKRQALTAITLALLAIIGYVAFRFDNPLWGAAGVAAIAHDVLITAGLFAALQLEVDLVIVAALLTIAGYSINDTIVIYDRMRDNMRHRRDDIGTLINDSINEMISRTLITNAMVFSVVLALFLLGGNVIHNFAFAMLVGSICGTYSTLAVSMPLIYQFQKGRRRSAEPEAPSSPSKPREGGRRRR